MVRFILRYIAAQTYNYLLALPSSSCYSLKPGLGSAGEDSSHGSYEGFEGLPTSMHN